MSNTKRLISDEYRAVNNELHEDEKFGSQGWKYANDVVRLCADNGYTEVLDYGCGKGQLKESLDEKGSKLTVHEYDPAIAGKEVDPSPCEFVLCSDVLEHVEPELLDHVLEHMSSKMIKAGFFSIATRPATRVLPDGRNAHLIVESAQWWKAKVEEYFTIVHEVDMTILIAFVVKLKT